MMKQNIGTFIVTNDKTQNTQISSNDIEYKAIGEGILSVFFDSNSSYTNNKIKIIANLNYLFRTSKFDGNIIEINGNIENSLFYSVSSFKNNVVTLNGNSPQYIVSLMNNNLNQNIEIENNKFIINDPEIWNADSKHFIFLYDITINNYDINIINNTIEASNQTNSQALIQLHSIHDTMPQSINISNNKYGIFKRIIFYNNQVSHKILIDGKEITYSTSLQ